MSKARILGTGICLPEKILTNRDLEKMVETTDEWIRSRTGIAERRIAGPETATSDLALEASRRALKAAKIEALELDVIIVATCTPDHLFPSVACLIQEKLGAKGACAFDVSAACSGFLYALGCVKALLESGTYRNALIVGADTLSKFTDWKDRSTCVLFGDGAGAMILSNQKKGGQESGVLSVYLGADGSGKDILVIPGGGSRHPTTENRWWGHPHAGINGHPATIKMEGQEVFKHAVRRMIEATTQALEMCKKKPTDLALLIPHQANLRIIEAIRERLHLPPEKIFRNIHKYGNMSAATTIIALDEAIRSKKVRKGDLVALAAFGAGLTWGAAVIRL
jgi:3-oxoacyl-[acyl-carrier-protein] synthase-3